MTIVRVNTGPAADLLLADLRDRNDITAEAIGPNEIRVSLLGSYRADAMALELVTRLRAWEEAARARGVDVTLEVLEDPPAR